MFASILFEQKACVSIVCQVASCLRQCILSNEATSFSSPLLCLCKGRPVHVVLPLTEGQTDRQTHETVTVSLFFLLSHELLPTTCTLAF